MSEPESVQRMAEAAAHGNRRGFRGRGPWTGVAWDIESGVEVGDCGHRHKVSTDEARNCPGLDRFDTIEVVTVRADQLAARLAAAEAVAVAAQRFMEAGDLRTGEGGESFDTYHAGRCGLSEALIRYRATPAPPRSQEGAEP